MRLPAAIAVLFVTASLSASETAVEALSLLNRHCTRCHGPKLQKSGFRLDLRDAALRGGDYGTAIQPGAPEESPLLTYVRHEEPDLEMPPLGKGDKLAAKDIALLEQWIREGAPWPTNPPVRVQFSFTPTIRAVLIDGNRARFEEQHGTARGVAGGISRFSLSGNLGEDSRAEVAGRVIAGQDDYRVGVRLERDEVGFLSFGAEQWTRFYDDRGGFQPGSPAPAPLGRDLQLDLGRSWIELGLVPPGGPAVTLGYEYAYKHGDKSMLIWGPAPGSGAGIVPSFKSVNEDVHSLRLEIAHEWRGTAIRDEALLQLHSLDTAHTFPGDVLSGVANPSTGRQRTETHTGANTLRLAREFRDDWFGEAAYHYSRLRSDGALMVVTTAAGVPGAGPHWSANNLLNETETHAFSLASLLGPFADFTVSPGFQTEWNRRRGAGAADLSYLALGPLTPVPVLLRSSRDERITTESVNLRYTGVAGLVLAGEVRLQQIEQGIFEQQIGGDTGFDPLITKAPSFLQRTDGDGARQNYEVSLRWAPGTRWAWTSRLSRDSEETGYLNEQSAITPIAAAGGLVSSVHPGFLRAWSRAAESWSNRLTVRPRRGLRCEITHRVQRTEHRVITGAAPADPSGGGERIASESDSHNIDLGVSLALHPRWSTHLSGSFTDAVTRSAANGVAAVTPWRGRGYGAAARTTVTLSTRTELQGAYSLSLAEFGQTATAGRTVAGTDYRLHSAGLGIRHTVRDTVLNLRYGLDRYDEPTSGGFNNYAAHTLFASMTLPWPTAIP